MAPEHTLDWLVELLDDCATPGRTSGGLPGHKSVPLDPTPAFADRANSLLFRGDGSLTLWLEEYLFPMPELDHAGQPIRRSCSKTVRAFATCESCGVEEDPSTWRIGPPLLLDSRSVSLGAHMERSTSQLFTLPMDELDARFRRLFDGKVEALESKLGRGLKLVTQVLE